MEELPHWLVLPNVTHFLTLKKTWELLSSQPITFTHWKSKFPLEPNEAVKTGGDWLFWVNTCSCYKGTSHFTAICFQFMIICFRMTTFKARFQFPLKTCRALPFPESRILTQRYLYISGVVSYPICAISSHQAEEEASHQGDFAACHNDITIDQA